MSDFYSDPLQSDFYNSYNNYPLEWSDFEISDLLIADNGSEEGSTSTQVEYGTPNPVPSEQHEVAVQNGGDNNDANSGTGRRPKAEGKKPKTDALRVAFRTKSELEIMDDGYKWRKYGKKSVKNSPNPRNYYRCSHQGCQVKKRVERDREDGSYVITTYDGVHSHESPSILYYDEIPFMVPNG